MRIGIFLVLAVLAVACKKPQVETAADESVADGPASVTQTLKGKSWTTKSNPSQSETRHELTATPGAAEVIANAVFKTHDHRAAATLPDCPAEYPYGVNLVSLTWTETYANGSSFEGKAKIPAGKTVCTDGSAFRVTKVEGKITKGKGDFKKVKSGDWEADITVGKKCNPTDKCPTTGNFEATFQY